MAYYSYIYLFLLKFLSAVGLQGLRSTYSGLDGFAIEPQNYVIVCLVALLTRVVFNKHNT